MGGREEKETAMEVAVGLGRQQAAGAKSQGGPRGAKRGPGAVAGGHSAPSVQRWRAPPCRDLLQEQDITKPISTRVLQLPSTQGPRWPLRRHCPPHPHADKSERGEPRLHRLHCTAPLPRPAAPLPIRYGTGWAITPYVWPQPRQQHRANDTLNHKTTRVVDDTRHDGILACSLMGQPSPAELEMAVCSAS